MTDAREELPRLRELQLTEGGEVNSVSAGIAHGHFTGHSGGGSGSDYQCEECPFEIADGIVVSGGSVAVLDERPRLDTEGEKE